jgi:hypothetical protein
MGQVNKFITPTSNKEERERVEKLYTSSIIINLPVRLCGTPNKKALFGKQLFRQTDALFLFL